MTYEQYWYGDPYMVKAYREADKIRQERMNNEAWLRGMYIYDAIKRLPPIATIWVQKSIGEYSYVKEPYQIFGSSEKTEQQEENELLQAELWMQQAVASTKDWGKGG